tara:strand:+ start:70 stop:255 length:186 start_codon:yes stop_codon:yes gene_type:complete
MVRNYNRVLVLNLTDVVVEHLFVGVAPEGEDQLEERCPGHDFQMMNGYSFCELWWKSVKVC